MLKCLQMQFTSLFGNPLGKDPQTNKQQGQCIAMQRLSARTDSFNHVPNNDSIIDNYVSNGSNEKYMVFYLGCMQGAHWGYTLRNYLCECSKLQVSAFAAYAVLSLRERLHVFITSKYLSSRPIRKVPALKPPTLIYTSFKAVPF